MTTKTAHLIFALLVLASFGLAAWAYPQLPSVIASHWNLAGQVDGYLPKVWVLAFAPVATVLIWGLWAFIPRIDPLSDNLRQFGREYNLLFLMIALVLVAIDKVTLIWNLGLRFPMTGAIVALLGLLFLGIGTLLPRIRRNYFVGIRTPWTLASDDVWAWTHARAGRWFLLAGCIAILAAFLPQPYGPLVGIAAPVLAAVWSVVDSYLGYRRGRHLDNPGQI